MKRRSERVRLKRLSAEAVGEAARHQAPPRSYAPSYDVAKASNLPVVVEKPALEYTVEKPNKNIPLVLLAYSLFLIGTIINGWFSYSRGSTEVDKALFLALGFVLEAVLFYLPAQTANLWRSRNLGGFIFGCTVCVFLFVFALTNSLGFASVNMHEITTARSERITPAIEDAQRRVDTLAASRASECVKRGDKCRQLEKEEQLALQALSEARQAVSATADPQIDAAAKLVAWASLDRFHPTQDDFAMLRLLLLTLLPQLGGLVLMLAARG